MRVVFSQHIGVATPRNHNKIVGFCLGDVWESGLRDKRNSGVILSWSLRGQLLKLIPSIIAQLQNPRLFCSVSIYMYICIQTLCWRWKTKACFFIIMQCMSQYNWSTQEISFIKKPSVLINHEMAILIKPQFHPSN